MPMTLNTAAWQKLIDENIEWLMQQPRTLERDHIEQVMRFVRKIRPSDYEAVGKLAALREKDCSQFQPEPHTEGKPDKWLILACRMLSFMDREDVETGIESEFDALRAENERLKTSRSYVCQKHNWCDVPGCSECAKEELREEIERLKQELKALKDTK